MKYLVIVAVVVGFASLLVDVHVYGKDVTISNTCGNQNKPLPPHEHFVIEVCTSRTLTGGSFFGLG